MIGHGTRIRANHAQPLAAQARIGDTSGLNRSRQPQHVTPRPDAVTHGDDPMHWRIYLAGEIHSSWREVIVEGAAAGGLPVTCVSPQTNHESSDLCGIQILGDEADPFWRDHKGASINAIRTRTILQRADVVVVHFGDKYRQWNAAFDAGHAVALGKPLITLHDADLDHALKEVDAAALAVARQPSQVVDILRYVTAD